MDGETFHGEGFDSEGFHGEGFDGDTQFRTQRSKFSHSLHKKKTDFNLDAAAEILLEAKIYSKHLHHLREVASNL